MNLGKKISVELIKTLFLDVEQTPASAAGSDAALLPPI